MYRDCKGSVRDQVGGILRNEAPIIKLELEIFVDKSVQEIADGSPYYVLLHRWHRGQAHVLQGSTVYTSSRDVAPSNHNCEGMVLLNIFHPCQRSLLHDILRKLALHGTRGLRQSTCWVLLCISVVVWVPRLAAI